MRHGFLRLSPARCSVLGTALDSDARPVAGTARRPPGATPCFRVAAAPPPRLDDATERPPPLACKACRKACHQALRGIRASRCPVAPRLRLVPSSPPRHPSALSHQPPRRSPRKPSRADRVRPPKHDPAVIIAAAAAAATTTTAITTSTAHHRHLHPAMPAYEYCCQCGGMIVISTTCTGCGHKQCTQCPAS